MCVAWSGHSSPIFQFAIIVSPEFELIVEDLSGGKRRSGGEMGSRLHLTFLLRTRED